MFERIFPVCAVATVLIIVSTLAWSEATGFKPGSYKAEIISATNDCGLITLERLKASDMEINGRWEHPETRGKLKVSIKNGVIQINWQGTLLISDREEIQINGKSLLIDVHLRHHFGNCSILFKIPDVMI